MLDPSKLRVNLPACSPFDVGLKVILIVQLDPAARELQEAAGAASKGEVAATLSAIEFPPSGFVTVSV